MPGGLTRVAERTDYLVVSMQRGGGSKDTWALSEGPVSALSLLRPPDQAVELSRGGAELPSRVADNLFWLGRYVERAEGTARLLRGILARLPSVGPQGAGIPALVDALAVARASPTCPTPRRAGTSCDRPVRDGAPRALRRRSSRRCVPPPSSATASRLTRGGASPVQRGSRRSPARRIAARRGARVLDRFVLALAAFDGAWATA
jgi:hypothetical protein